MGKGPFKLRSQGSSFKTMGSSPVTEKTEKTEKIEKIEKPRTEIKQNLNDPYAPANLTPEKIEELRSHFAERSTDEEVDSFPGGNEEGEILQEKKIIRPEIGHTVVSRTGRSPGAGYEKIKGTNQWEYTGYGV